MKIYTQKVSMCGHNIHDVTVVKMEDGMKYCVEFSLFPEKKTLACFTITALPRKKDFSAFMKKRNPFAVQTAKKSLRFFQEVMILLEEEFGGWFVECEPTDKRRCRAYENWLKKSNRNPKWIEEDYLQFEI